MSYGGGHKVSTILLSIALTVSIITVASLTVAFRSEQVRINEIMYHPLADTCDEWIEIYNEGDGAVDLTDWTFLESGVHHGLTVIQGSMNLPSKGYAVIARDSDAFLAFYSSYEGILFDSYFALHNQGETIALINDQGDVVDEVTYEAQSGADGTGHTLEYAEEEVWEVSLVYGGTPGTLNSVSSPLSVTKTVWDGSCWVHELEGEVGDALRFNITVENSGIEEYVLYNMEIRDTLPALLEYTGNALLNGEPREPDVQEPYVVTWVIPAGELIIHQGEKAFLEFDTLVVSSGCGVNVVNVTSEYCDPYIDYVYGADTVCIDIAGAEGIDIIKKVKFQESSYQDEVTVPPNAEVTFRLEIFNFEQHPLDLSVRDELPPGLSYVPGSAMVNGEPLEPEICGIYYYWNFTDLASGASITITFNAVAVGFGELVNRANVTGDDGEVLFYDEDIATVIIEKIAFSKQVWDATEQAWVKSIEAHVNDTLRFNITLSYFGSGLLMDILVTDYLPFTIEYADNASIQETGYDPYFNIVWWEISALVPGDTLSILFDGLVIDVGNTTNRATLLAEECGTSEEITAEDTVTLLSYYPLVADAGGPYNATVGEEIELLGQAFGGIEPYDYSWDLDNDGLFDDATGSQVLYSWESEEVFTIALKVKDTLDNEAVNTTVVVVTYPPLLVDAGGPYSGLIGQEIQLQGSAEGGAVPYQFFWDLDDDGTYDDATGDTPTYSWDDSGNYSISLKVKDSANHQETNDTMVSIREKLSISIVHPTNDAFYFRDRKIKFLSLPVIIGPVKIRTEVEHEIPLDRVEFYIDGIYRGNATQLDDDDYYSWLWNDLAFLGHTIRVVAVDTQDNMAQDTLSVVVFSFCLKLFLGR